jgi:hypothetical protein
MGRHAAPGDNESGAVIILALVFLIAVGGVIAALTGLVGSDLVNTTHFATDRSVTYAADSATEIAMWSTRNSYTTPTSTPSFGLCPGTASPLQPLDGIYIQEWCSTASGTSLDATRVVTLEACEVASPSGIASVCGAPMLTAVVTFNDFSIATAPTPPGPNVDDCTAKTVVTCGTTMTINSWVGAGGI